MPKTQKECIALIEQIRWGGTPKCPYCMATTAAKIRRENRYHCNTCFTSFSVTVGTLFHGTHVDLTKWFKAIHLVKTSPNHVSVRKLAAEIQVAKNTASSMLARIRRAMEDEAEVIEQICQALRSHTP
ncbi:MAG: hypothetical protein Kow00121_45710 [Elainellaceae cyanobacterium]